MTEFKEYEEEYREFIPEMLKSLFIEKDLKQHETKDTLIKKWKQIEKINILYLVSLKQIS